MDLLKERDSGGLCVRHAVNEKPNNNGVAPHIHERCEVFYFISGNAGYLVEGTVYPLEKYSVMIMRPGEAHCIRFLSDERYERYAVNFPLSLFDSFDPQRRLMQPFTDRPLGRHNLYSLPGLEDDLRELAYYEGDDYGRRILFITKLADIMDKLGRHTCQMPSAAPVFSEQLVRYVNDMLYEEITVERLAEHFFLSTSQFSRLFREATGASPWAYITAKRLIRARELLQGGERAKITAELCGFRDYSVFYKAYVKRFGEKPSGNT
ncbi:AraC family transcriptional regulator [Ruminococcus sp.]|uniref:AraC family transcriptional regulator n=1 Tax=Ruminococcus sp. TaxID=41978 RepID=UPI0026014E9E|nr:AraC family transcriptional regulator [Ruminococcus sp.]MBQ8966727.1 helix-turn-helix domain-containing protein [Ruminococcus sp.]